MKQLPDKTLFRIAGALFFISGIIAAIFEWVYVVPLVPHIHGTRGLYAVLYGLPLAFFAAGARALSAQNADEVKAERAELLKKQSPLFLPGLLLCIVLFITAFAAIVQYPAFGDMVARIAHALQ